MAITTGRSVPPSVAPRLKSGSAKLGHILVAYDGSRGAIGACKAASSLAEKCGARVTVLHVIPAPSIVTSLLSSDRYSRSLEEGTKLAEEAASLIEKGGIRVRWKAVQSDGSVVRTIVAFASASKSDFTIVGSRGMGGLKRILLGSVSSGVVAHSKCSVMVSRANPSADRPRFKRILVAIDGSESARAAVGHAASIAKCTRGQLAILHVIHIPEAVYSSGAASAPKMEEEARLRAEGYVAEALAIAKASGVAAKFLIVENMQSQVGGILGVAEEEGSELVVVGTRGLGGFKKLLMGSVSTGVVNYAPCSVLVVR